MIIIGAVKADASGRVNISKLFDTTPQKVLVAYDTDRKLVTLFDTNTVIEKWKNSDPRTPDGKGRVCFPKWILENLGEEFLIADQYLDQHCLIPKKFLNL